MKKVAEYIIYQGEKFTLEWFYDEQGHSDALEYFEELDEATQKRFLHLVKRMGDAGKIHNKTAFNYEHDEIWAFKPQPHRFLCFFFVGKKIVVTNAFHKKQDKLPREEKNRALRRKTSYESRIEKGTYYD
jgi:phage-related protein